MSRTHPKCQVCCIIRIKGRSILSRMSLAFSFSHCAILYSRVGTLYLGTLSRVLSQQTFFCCTRLLLTTRRDGEISRLHCDASGFRKKRIEFRKKNLWSSLWCILIFGKILTKLVQLFGLKLKKYLLSAQVTNSVCSVFMDNKIIAWIPYAWISENVKRTRKSNVISMSK